MVKEHYNHWLPKVIRKGGITLGHHIFYARPRGRVPDSLRAHERCHVAQYFRFGLLGMVVRYVCEFVINITWHHSWREAYLNISLEAEARQAEGEPWLWI